MKQPRTIRHDIQITVTVAGCDPYQQTVPFIYNPARSFAVAVDFSTATDRCLWRVDRETFALGRDKPTIDPSGDMQVRPAVVDGVASVFIILRPGCDNTATLTVPRAPFDAFVNDMFRQVPRGRELQHLDWRRAIDELVQVGA